MVPLFAWMLLAHPDDFWWRVGTAAVFTVAILTDLLDGHLARKHNIVTDFGKIADPIADKALTGMAFVGLSILGELWWWVTIVILIREWGITLMRFLVLRQGVVLAANRGGKAKTVAQAVALILMLLPIMAPFNAIGQIAMAIAFALTVITGIDYLVSTIKRWKQQKGSTANPAGIG
ncbi:CDP-diacylglycerol--glycerol-3-phosphate 3-phosphatidyltransferase [Propionibacteriaceae bacterium Y1685]